MMVQGGFAVTEKMDIHQNHSNLAFTAREWRVRAEMGQVIMHPGAVAVWT